MYKRTGKEIECLVCGTVKYRYPSQIKKGYLYCSKKCWYSVLSTQRKGDKKWKDHLNAHRHKIDHWNPEKREKASRSMRLAYTEGRAKKRFGAKNNLWKGGIATLQNVLRKTSEYREWRIAVFERDNYTCQDCGDRGGQLHAHHIKEFAKYPELRYEVSNGRTLCVDCPPRS